jgi:hypothetical protein
MSHTSQREFSTSCCMQVSGLQLLQNLRESTCLMPSALTTVCMQLLAGVLEGIAWLYRPDIHAAHVSGGLTWPSTRLSHLPSDLTCLPTYAGGAKVLDGLGSSLHLNPWHLEPSRAVLRFYGNVSSASTW